MHKKIIFFVFSLAVFLSLTSFLCAQEQITVTTYYPSPVGAYDELEAQHLAVGYPVGTPAGQKFAWNNFLQVGTGYGDTIGIGGDNMAVGAEIRISALATRNTVTFVNNWLGRNARIVAANVPGCRVVNYTANDLPNPSCNCGDWNCNGVIELNLGESATSRISFVADPNAVYPQNGWYLCCET